MPVFKFYLRRLDVEKEEEKPGVGFSLEGQESSAGDQEYKGAEGWTRLRLE